MFVDSGEGALYQEDFTVGMRVYEEDYDGSIKSGIVERLFWRENDAFHDTEDWAHILWDDGTKSDELTDVLKASAQELKGGA